MIEHIRRIASDVGEVIVWTRVAGPVTWIVVLLLGLFVFGLIAARRIPGESIQFGRDLLRSAISSVAGHFVLAWQTALRVIFWRRDRRRRLGLCLKCGYPIQQTAGRCPECGP